MLMFYRYDISNKTKDWVLHCDAAYKGPLKLLFFVLS